VASLYAIILTVFVYREAKLKDIYTVLREAAQESASTMLVVASSTFYGYVITRLQIPTLILNFFLSVSSNKAIFLILINIFFLFVGCFMECNSAILILTPIVLPAAVSFGIDPIHFGLIMVFNLMIGLLTPPVGMCLYATMRVAKISFDRMVRSVVPFFIPLLITLILITYIPQITLFLPNLLG
jgi:C4-dicarboxylate transporter DctM subunit